MGDYDRAWDANFYDHGAHVFHIENTEYGASTGGTAADNATAIQATIAAAIAAGGGIVQCGSGTYSYDTTLTLGESVTLQGNGPEATILSYTGSANAIEHNETEHWQVRDLSLAGTASAHEGIYIRKVWLGFRLTNLYITGFTHATYGRGVYLDPSGTSGKGVYFGQFDSVRVDGCRVGFKMLGHTSSNCNVHLFNMCWALNCTGNGWEVDYADGITLVASESEDNAGLGIDIDHTNSFTMIGGWIESNAAGAIDFTANTRMNLWHPRIGSNDVLYEGAPYEQADLTDKVRFLMDQNGEPDSPKDWFGRVDTNGGTWYGTTRAERAADTSTALAGKVTGDANDRFNLMASGRMDYGPGSGAADLTVKRAGAGVLSMTKLGVGNSAAATTPGSVAKKVEIFDDSGASIGFIAVYDGIT